VPVKVKTPQTFPMAKIWRESVEAEGIFQTELDQAQ
jgi:hypothetical protein